MNIIIKKTSNMAQFTILLFFALSILLFSCKEKVEEKQSTVTSTISKIEVIDFHSTHRCVTCKAIESNAKYTVETYFADEQKRGIVIFKTINVDDDKNYAIAERFQAYGTALFLNVIKDGKETHIDLTDFGFSKAKNQEKFSIELKIKIENELKKL